MALDSHGRYEGRSVSCLLCRRVIYFTTYTPECGHAGGVLDVGPRIERDRAGELQVAQFIRVILHVSPSENLTGVPDRYELIMGLTPSTEPYHYEGFEVPDFEDKKKPVLCICGTCCQQSWSIVAVKIGKVLEERNREIPVLV